MKLRHLVLFTALAIAMAGGTARAQSTGDYRTKASGAWSSTSTWERYNGSSWVNAPSSPTSADGVITILNGHTVTVTGDVTIDQTVINSGGVVDVNTNNADLRVANGTGVDLDVSGTLKLTHNGASIVRNSTSAEIKIENGGLYQHGQNAGWIVLATWADGSTCEVNGNGTNANDIDSLDQSFYNLVWNMTGAGGGGSKDIDELVTVRNDFTILQISGTSLEFAQQNDRTINIGGDFVVTNPSETITINQGPGNITVNVDGNFLKEDDGKFQLSGGNGTGRLNLKGNFTHTGGIFTEEVPDMCWIRFIGTTDQTAYTYNVDNMQNEINVEVDKSGGRVLLGSNFRVNGPATLKMTQGNILTYNYVLTLGESTSSRGTLDWTSGTIVGYFRRWYAASTVSNVLYPIGTETWHRPAELSFTGAPSTGGTVTGSFHDVDPGTYGLPLTENNTTYSTVCPDGYWRMTAGDGLAGGTYRLDLTATGFGCVTDPSTIAIIKRADDLSPWTLNGTHVAGTGTVSVPVAHRTGMSGFSEFGISGAGDTPLPIELAEFDATSANGNVNLTWRTGAEVNNEGFEVQRASEGDADFRTIASYRTNPELAGLGTSFIGRSYGFTDDGSYGVLVTGATYRYRLIDVSRDGSRTIHPERSVRIEGAAAATPGMLTLALGSATPNPATDAVNVVVTLAEPGPVSIELYAADGRLVATPLSAELAEGQHPMSVDTRDLRPGAYALRLVTPAGIRSQQFLIVR
jgi:hypothetical protein